MCWGISTSPPPSPGCQHFFSTQRRPVKGAGCQAAVPNPFAIPSVSNQPDTHPMGLSQTRDTDLVLHPCRGYPYLQHPCRTPSWQGAAAPPPAPPAACRSRGMGRGAGIARGQQGEDPAHGHPSRTNSKSSSLGASESTPAAGSGRGWWQLACAQPLRSQSCRRGFSLKKKKTERKRKKKKDTEEQKIPSPHSSL